MEHPDDQSSTVLCTTRTHFKQNSEETKDRSPSEKRAETDNTFVAVANNLNDDDDSGQAVTTSSSVRKNDNDVIQKSKTKKDRNCSIFQRRRSNRDINVLDEFNFQYPSLNGSILQ